jgi:hypothetical protein
VLTRTIRERLVAIERLGLTVIDIARSRHWKVRIAAPDGPTMLIVVSVTPSNWRAAYKFRAQLQRFVRPVAGEARNG